MIVSAPHAPAVGGGSASLSGDIGKSIETLVAALFGSSQSPVGGVDIAALARAITSAVSGNEAFLGLVVSSLGRSLSPVDRGVLARHLDNAVGGGAIGSGRAATIPGRAAGSANIPALEKIAKDPVVAAAIDKAWTASNPNKPGAKQEQGFWVVRDDKSGKLSVVAFPSTGTNDSLTPGPQPSIKGKSTVAFFHTHPNTVKEGYVNGPSPADRNFARANSIPGIIRSHVGMYYFKP